MREATASNRLCRGHRMLGKRRWEDAVQATVSSENDLPWQCAAQGREHGHALEASFIARVARTADSSVDEMPRGRPMLRAEEV